MRFWIEQHKDAVAAVQDHVFDVQMAKASAEELEALHRVLQAEGIQGLRALEPHEGVPVRPGGHHLRGR